MVLATGLATSQATRWQGYLDSGATLTITLKRIPPQENARVSFRVLDALGRPVAGAYLADMNGNPQQACFAVTDEDGRAPARSVPPGTFQFLAYHPLWINPITSESVLLSAGEEREVQAILPARSALKGRVTYPDGRPVKGAYVAIPPVFDVVQKNRLSITNANGEYAIPSVPTSGSYRLAAVGPELRTSVNLQIQGQPDQTLTVDLVLPFLGANTVQGTAFQPMEGTQVIPAMAQVWVQGLLPSIYASEYGNTSWGLLFEETTGAQQTGSDGKFSLKGLPQGAYSLHANSDLFPVEVKVAGDFGTKIDDSQERNITLVSSFAGELKGIITQRDGQTPAPVGTRVRLLGGSIGELIVNTVEKGRYAFAKVIPAGDYKIRVEDSSTGDITVTSIRMEKEASQVRNLRLWGRGNLTVKVQDSFGKVLPEGDVTFAHGYDTGLLDADDLPERAQKLLPENNGILHFEDLLEGPVTLSLRNPIGLQGVATVTMPLGGGDAEVIIRLQPVGYIRGLLTRADGSRVPAGRVDAYQGSRWLGVSTARQEGEDGRFLFGVLPTGTITLVGWDPDVRQVGRAEVEVREGQTTEVNLQTQDKGPVVITVTQEGQPVLRAGIHLQYRGGAALDFSTEATSDTQGKA
ncbi:MAG: carboxypeptidase-like regulatory domain-containing protein, partial [Holophaga sp.]